MDASPDVGRLLRYLDDHDQYLSAIKSYVAATAHGLIPGGRILDLGCGVGHDLVRMADAGLTPVGIDSSAAALDRASTTGAPLIRADAHRLPLATGCMDGCRIERLLLHVTDPARVLDEVLRVVRPHGMLAIFEPDYTTFRVRSDVEPSGSLPGRLTRLAQPGIGGQLSTLLEERGCFVRDVVTEDSRAVTLADYPQDALDMVRQAAGDGRLHPHLAAAWVDEQLRRDAAGEFKASWTKVLVVARTPGGRGRDNPGIRAGRRTAPDRSA